MQLNHIFQYINKTQIPTGYLDEYGAQFVDKKPYNGVLSDSNIIRELTVFKLIYNDVSTAKINPAASSLPSIDTLNGIFSGEFECTIVGNNCTDTIRITNGRFDKKL